MTTRILVWDLPTRFFHWALACSFIGAFLTAESERYRDLHEGLGYTMLGLLVFRLIWGVAGTRYARFSEFVRGPVAVVADLRGLALGRPRHYTGHNPLGAWAIVLLIASGFLVSASGWLLEVGVADTLFEELHEAAANAMLALVVVHVAGVILASLLHRENLVFAMWAGYKRGSPSAAIARSRPVVALLLAAGLTAFWAWNLLDHQPSSRVERGFAAAGGAHSVVLQRQDND
jgi:cytochrome b